GAGTPRRSSGKEPAGAFSWLTNPTTAGAPAARLAPALAAVPEAPLPPEQAVAARARAAIRARSLAGTVVAARPPLTWPRRPSWRRARARGRRAPPGGSDRRRSGWGLSPSSPAPHRCSAPGPGGTVSGNGTRWAGRAETVAPR